MTLSRRKLKIVRPSVSSSREVSYNDPSSKVLLLLLRILSTAGMRSSDGCDLVPVAKKRASHQDFARVLRQRLPALSSPHDVSS